MWLIKLYAEHDRLALKTLSKCSLVFSEWPMFVGKPSCAHLCEYNQDSTYTEDLGALTRASIVTLLATGSTGQGLCRGAVRFRCHICCMPT